MKVILMPASGFHKAEGTGKFKKKHQQVHRLVEEDMKDNTSSVLAMIPLEERPLVIF